MKPNEIDLGKHAILGMDLTQGRVSMDGFSRAYQDSREASQRMVMLLPLSRAGESHYRLGDDPVEAFLGLTSEQQARVPDECRAAREIKSERETARALQVRIDALRPQVDALSQLVKACDLFISRVQA